MYGGDVCASAVLQSEFVNRCTTLEYPAICDVLEQRYVENTEIGIKWKSVL